MHNKLLKKIHTAMEEKKNSVICIIGMHRSGTSMIAQLLNMCELDLGPSDQLLPANESNLFGYFENEKFTYKIDETLLAHFGGSWDNPPLFKEGWELDSSLEQLYKEAKFLIQTFSKSSNWGWKDPRATILLPFWKSLIPNLRFVICVRSPLEVAKSLYRRDRFPIHKGVYLWNQYMKAAVRDTEGCARIFVFYEDFFEDATLEINRLVEFCGLQKPDSPSILLNAISQKLKHHTSETSELLNDDKIVTEHKLFYIGLRALTNNKFLRPTLDNSREELVSENISKFFKLLEEFHDEQKMAQLQSASADKNQQIAKLHDTVYQKKKELAQKEEQANKFHSTLQSQQKTLEEREQNVADLKASIKAKEQTIIQQCELTDRITIEKNQLSQALHVINNSLGWKLTNKLYSLEDKILRSGTFRRKIYDSFWENIKTIVNNGWKIFMNEPKMIIKLKKIIQKLCHGSSRLLRFVNLLYSLLLIGILILMSMPLAVGLALALLCSDVWVSLHKSIFGATPVNPQDADQEPVRNKALRVTQPVSVVIPTWNACKLLDMSLPPLISALATHAPGGEIIVVDNCSNDDTCKYLAKEFPGVRVIKLPRNEGFAKAANRGVSESQYSTVILLNNDMVVEQDFIFPLLKVFDDEPTTFGVSSQIYFLDEKKPRWETGKVHARWDLGTITLFHLYRWEEDLVYPVFYAGGGASAYNREKFLALDGFDEKVFEPVYIEDADLGYRAWKRGWPSLFAPKSVVHHKHRSTTSRLWSEGAIYSFFVKNLAALVWKNIGDIRLIFRHLCGLIILPARVYKNAGNASAFMTYWRLIRQIPRVIRARVRENLKPRTLDDQTIMEVSRYRYAFRAHFGHRSHRVQKRLKRMLMVSPYSPYPPVHGGAVRMFSLLKRLRHTFDIDLISYADTPAELDPMSITELKKICRQVVLVERDVSTVGGILEPSQTRGFKSEEMAEEVEFFLDREDYDVVQVEYTHMAHFMPSRVQGMARVLVEHDVSFVSLGRSRATSHGLIAHIEIWFDWMRMLRYEIRAVENADLVIVMSETDKAILGKFVDTKSIFSIPNGVDCEEFKFTANHRESCSVLFVGFFRHEPNVQAVKYFCRDVLPLVRNSHPDVYFRIVGAYPPETIRLLGNEAGIEVTGRVEDIGCYYRHNTIFVVPILQGSGTRLKILEAMASGCPVVSTTIGAEGLGTIDGEHILIADTPEAMAKAIDTLLSDPEFGTNMAKHAQEYVITRYDWDVVTARLLEMYNNGLS